MVRIENKLKLLRDKIDSYHICIDGHPCSCNKDRRYVVSLLISLDGKGGPHYQKTIKRSVLEECNKLWRSYN